MSNTVPTPITDKNGKNTTVHRKVETASVNSRVSGSPLPTSSQNTPKLTLGGLELLAVIGARGVHFLGNGFNEASSRVGDGSFTGDGGWIAKEGAFHLNDSAIKKFIKSGLVTVVPTDHSADLELTTFGMDTITDNANNLSNTDGTPVGGWMELYANMTDSYSRGYKTSIYDAGDSVFA